MFFENLPRPHIPKLLQRTTSHSLRRQSKRPWTAAAGRARPTVSLRSGAGAPGDLKELGGHDLRRNSVEALKSLGSCGPAMLTHGKLGFGEITLTREIQVRGHRATPPHSLPRKPDGEESSPLFWA